jgi:transcriptional regulator with XRE-family HTH domain
MADDAPTPTVWTYLRDLRDESGHTNRSLARAVGASESYLSQVVLGRRAASGTLLRLLALELGTTVEELEATKPEVVPYSSAGAA